MNTDKSSTIPSSNMQKLGTANQLKDARTVGVRKADKRSSRKVSD
jgi:hypothetical protein